MKKLLLTVLCGFALHGGVVAQDLHFSQTIQTPLLINPAAAGVFDGWERISVNHRNQWLGSSTSFMSTAVAADANFAKSDFNNSAYFGVGMMFYTDVGGDGSFGNQQGSLTLSGILPMGGGSTLSAGIQGGFGQRSVNVGALTFNSQWNGNGFDPTINSGETNLGSSFAYIDASGGLMYQFDGGQSTFARNNDFKFQLGFSGYHLNAPELKYSSGFSGERLARKWVAHTRVIAEVPGSKWSVDASAVQFIQGGHYETILGGMTRWRFENGTKITGMAHNAYLAFGAYFRVFDAIIPSVMIDWRGFQFGVSYDVTVSKLRNVNSGSLEFSLAYRNLNDSLFKTKYRKL
mmetsp:Transcript_30896/g.41019  ORF Transcript_30896/g.41019 Transcript_30896/m.41019 type:complete len:347 (+) Transcript_30896:2980-4020(+)